MQRGRRMTKIWVIMVNGIQLINYFLVFSLVYGLHPLFWKKLSIGTLVERVVPSLWLKLFSNRLFKEISRHIPPGVTGGSQFCRFSAHPVTRGVV